MPHPGLGDRLFVDYDVPRNPLEDSAPLPVVVAERPPALKFIVVDDEGTEQQAPLLPDVLPDWAMSLATHHETMQRTAVYRCTSCGGEHEEYRTSPRDLPYAKVCGCIVEVKDGIEIEKCTAVAIRRVTYPGEGVALNARRFEPLVIYERGNFESASDDYKRSHNRFYFPGRNNEPTEPGMKRIEITSIQQYNQVVKGINEYETQKMRDHREMHREYWKQRRSAMRDDVNARIRHSPLLVALSRMVRRRSDQKSDRRYGKPLDAHFHAQLIEFNQSNMQDWCAEDSGGRKGWKSQRAK